MPAIGTGQAWGEEGLSFIDPNPDIRRAAIERIHSHIPVASRLGAVINMSLARELGPVLAATMLAGRVGSAMAAELGTMRVTEQIDALSSMGANPVQYLVVPRFLSFVLLIPTLTAMAVFMGVVGGYFYSVVILGIDKHHYLYNTQQFVDSFDLFSGLIKSVFFGAAIAISGCMQGMKAGNSAAAVGEATTRAVVASITAVIVLDSAFAAIFTLLDI